MGPFSDAQNQQSMRTLTVEEVDSAPSSENTLDYSEMSPDQQEIFVLALNSEDGDAKIPEEASYEIWIDDDYVEYNESIYRVVVAVS